MRQQTLIKIVALMRKELDKKMTILEISKKLKIGYLPAYNHIKGMEEAGLIRVERAGNAKLCSLDLSAQKTRHLLGEVDIMRSDDVLNKAVKLRSIVELIISRIGDSPGLHAIVLFGSHAKGSAGRDSDVDLLFIVSDLKDRVLRSLIERECAGVRGSYHIIVNPVITDPIEFKKMVSSPDLNVGKEVRSYGISLLGSEAFWRLTA